MPDSKEFFETILPAKVTGNADLVKSVNAVFSFDIKDAGAWTLDLTPEGNGAITEGKAENAGCLITTDQKSWEAILENPSKAVQFFMLGKLKTNNVGLATKLQQILA